MTSTVLVTGVSRYVGAEFARELSRDPRVDRVIGVDLLEPRYPLGAAEFVRADIGNPLVGKVIAQAGVDTVVHLSVSADDVGDGSVRVVNLRNDGVLPFLPDDHVIEVPARFDGATFVAEPVAALPDDIAGLIGAVTGYERLALDAAVHGGRDRVLRAMRAHPLVLQHDRAERLTDLLLAANARFLPWA